MVYVTSVHFENGKQHQHIASVRWLNPSDNKTGETTTEEMVKWINGGGSAKVQVDRNTVEVKVVDAKPPYLRTYADGVWKDNLLALPTY